MTNFVLLITSSSLFSLPFSNPKQSPKFICSSSLFSFRASSSISPSSFFSSSLVSFTPLSSKIVLPSTASLSPVVSSGKQPEKEKNIKETIIISMYLLRFFIFPNIIIHKNNDSFFNKKSSLEKDKLSL